MIKSHRWQVMVNNANVVQNRLKTKNWRYHFIDTVISELIAPQILITEGLSNVTAFF